MGAHPKYRRVNITLPEDVYRDFMKCCQSEGMNLSSRIAVLIRRDTSSLLAIKRELPIISGYRKSDVVRSGALSPEASRKLQKVFRKKKAGG